MVLVFACTEIKKSCESMIHSFPFAREERLELPTLGFGDRCSTN